MNLSDAIASFDAKQLTWFAYLLICPGLLNLYMFLSCILVFIQTICTQKGCRCFIQHKTKENKQEKQLKPDDEDKNFPFPGKNIHQFQSKKYLFKSIQFTIMNLFLNNTFIDIILFPSSTMIKIFPEYDLIIYSLIKYIFHWTVANNFTFGAILSVQLYLISDSLKQNQGVQCLRKYCLINNNNNNRNKGNKLSFKISYTQILLIWFMNGSLYAILPLYLDLVELSWPPSVNIQNGSLSLLVKFSCMLNSCLVQYLYILYTLLSFSQLVISLIFLNRVHSLIICVKNLINSLSSNEISMDSMIKQIEIKTNSSFITSMQSKASSRTSNLKFNALLEYTRGIWTIRLFGITILFNGFLYTLQNLLKSFDSKIDFSVTSFTGNLLLIKTLSDPILLTYGFKSLRHTMFDICNLCYYCNMTSEKSLSSTSSV